MCTFHKQTEEFIHYIYLYTTQKCDVFLILIYEQAELESVFPVEAVSLKYVLICSTVCDCRLGGVGCGGKGSAGRASRGSRRGQGWGKRMDTHGTVKGGFVWCLCLFLCIWVFVCLFLCLWEAEMRREGLAFSACSPSASFRSAKSFSASCSLSPRDSPSHSERVGRQCQTSGRNKTTVSTCAGTVRPLWVSSGRW